MSDVLERIEALRAEALTAIDGASDTAALEELRVQVLGRKAELPNLLRGVAELPPEQRGAVGKAANVARKEVEARLEERVSALAAGELDVKLAADTVDLTLPGAPPRPVGRLTTAPPCFPRLVRIRPSVSRMRRASRMFSNSHTSSAGECTARTLRLCDRAPSASARSNLKPGSP